MAQFPQLTALDRTFCYKPHTLTGFRAYVANAKLYAGSTQLASQIQAVENGQADTLVDSSVVTTSPVGNFYAFSSMSLAGPFTPTSVSDYVDFNLVCATNDTPNFSLQRPT